MWELFQAVAEAAMSKMEQDPISSSRFCGYRGYATKGIHPGSGVEGSKDSREVYRKSSAGRGPQMVLVSTRSRN